MSLPDPQFNRFGKLHHFIDVAGLDRQTLLEILDAAERFVSPDGRATRKVPLLRGKTVANLFFENSTRTRTAFELAAKRLSADILNIDLVTSSTTKGESLLDTLRVLENLQCDMFIVRHGDSGAAHFIARHVAATVNVVNGGDGQHAHPTQAMLDIFTIRRHKPRLDELVVTIIGDIRHSRVARSNISALTRLGVGELRVAAPRTLLPEAVEALGVRVYTDVDRALADADVIMGLRLQNERMEGATIPSSGEFYRTYGLTRERLARARADAIVMHPGPTNRGVEIAGAVADGPRSVILEQVNSGLAVRMAILSIVMGHGEIVRAADRSSRGGYRTGDTTHESPVETSR